MTTRDERRLEKNEASKNHAEHYREPWLDHEVELLLQWDGSDSELSDLAELLGRTREACRQRYYESRSGRSRTVHTRTSVTVTRESTVTHWSAEDDDEWRSDWYVR